MNEKIADQQRLLILGGTTEGREIVERLGNDPRFAIIVSLAGRTQNPIILAAKMRIGGFGGVEGLKSYLSRENIQMVLDATHPFATIIKANAADACQALGLPLLAIRRPEWQCESDDSWISVANVTAACEALGTAPRRAFLTLGRLELKAFMSAPQHDYLVRSVDRLASPLAFQHIEARGPFAFEDEIALLREHRIEVLVTKNSGGAATYAKIAAARALQLPVIMIQRPSYATPLAAEQVFENVEALLAWLLHHSNRYLRGV